MIAQLMLSKRLYLEAAEFSLRADPVSCGIAISMLQDAAEMLVWTLIKTKGVPVKDADGFVSNLEALKKRDIVANDVPQLLELNKARVGFKHYGNLPAPVEASKFRSYVQDFLRGTMSAQFGVDFDSLSLVDLIPIPNVRERLKMAEQHLAQGDFQRAVEEASIAKVELFDLLHDYIPPVDRGLRDADRLLLSSHVRAFEYLTKYLNVLRDASLASMLRLSLDDFAFLNSTLFTAYRASNGNWHTVNTRFREADAPMCQRQIACLTEISLAIQALMPLPANMRYEPAAEPTPTTMPPRPGHSE